MNTFFLGRSGVEWSAAWRSNGAQQNWALRSKQGEGVTFPTPNASFLDAFERLAILTRKCAFGSGVKNLICILRRTQISLFWVGIRYKYVNSYVL